MKQFRSYTSWWLVGFITWILNQILAHYPWIVEIVYFRSVYQLVRILQDYTFSLLCIPNLYLLLIIMICLWYWGLKFLYNTYCGLTFWKHIAASVLAFLSGAYFLFYLLWGFNYHRPKLEHLLNLEIQNISESQLFEELEEITKEMADIRLQLSSDSTAIDEQLIPLIDENEIRYDLELFLTSFDFPTYGRVRVRKLYPKGSLLHLSTAGVYIPFVSEGHIDPGLHPIVMPSTMTHEMAHGYGFGPEGECNFIAYIVGRNSSNSFYQYSSLFGYWRYLVSNARRANQDRFEKFRSTIPRGIVNDYYQIIDLHNQYEDWIPDIRDLIYDQYLKSNNVQGGLKNYSKIIKLNIAFKEKHPEFFE